MILTGNEIRRQWELGAIVIDPFDEQRINPNSYNFTLGEHILVYTDAVLDARSDNPTAVIAIDQDEGLVLEPGRLYLAHTREVLGSSSFAPTFSARSSVARIGLSIHLSSGLGDIGFQGHWTLQLVATEPVRVFAGMAIGQMMWWTPEGEITQYDGKYQGAQGPTASRCYRTLDSEIARDRFPSLHTHGLTEQRVGAKFLNLARMARKVVVPEAIVVPVEEAGSAMSAAVMEGLAAAFADVHATVGANLLADGARIADAVAGTRMSSRAQELIVSRMREVFGDGCRFAVRSSAVGEDSETVSHAGAYQSYLDIGADDVVDAITGVWKSYYSIVAVTGRIRVGDFDPTARIAVIVQRVVEPDVAGIAMTGLYPGSPDQVSIEAVAGRGDALAAGIDSATTDPMVLSRELSDAVHRLARSAARQLGYRRIDIEWAYAAGQLYLLQARPNTAPTTPGHRDQPAVLRLYDDPIPADVPLGPVGPSCLHYVRKRGRATELASELGIARGAAFLLYLPADGGFTECFATIATRLDIALSGKQVILDATDYIRQIVIDYSQLHEELHQLRSATPHREPLTVLVREYVTGDHGLITRRHDTDSDIYGEACADGLLAMNRGTGTYTGFTIRADATVDSRAASLLGNPENASLIAGLTARMERELGPVAIEWVVEDGTLYYVDHTVTASDPGITTTTSAVTISPGRCVGRVVSLTDHPLLHRLSVAPAISIGGGVDVSGHRLVADMVARIHDAGPGVVVHARRPYAILAALTSHASGFLFDDASQLCHLAIILREQRIPAAIHTAVDGQYLMLDDGAIHTIEGPAS